jgi:hypothetical protein
VGPACLVIVDVNCAVIGAGRIFSEHRVRQGLECLGESGLLQDGVSQMTRGNMIIDCEIPIG